MTDTNITPSVWQRILRKLLIAMLIVATLVSVFVFCVAGLPKIKSHITKEQMTRYTLTHCEELTNYALQLHENSLPYQYNSYQDWTTYWCPIEGTDTYIVVFIVRSWGIAPSSGEDGVYYSSDSSPHSLAGNATLDREQSVCICPDWYWYSLMT